MRIVLLRALSLALLAGCRPSQPVATETPTTAPVAEAPPAAEPATPEPRKRDITVINMGGVDCKAALWAGAGMPGPDAPTIVLPLRRPTTIAMAEDEGLALQKADGTYGVLASTDTDEGQLLISDRCGSIAASDKAFTPRQLAIAAPHVIGVCCGACDGQGCTGCTEPKPGARCKGKSIAAKCSFIDDVLDCVPATAVDADGKVGGDYAPMGRLFAPAPAPAQ